MVKVHPAQIADTEWKGKDRVRSVASRRKAQHGSSRTELREGEGLSPGDTKTRPTRQVQRDRTLGYFRRG